MQRILYFLIPIVLFTACKKEDKAEPQPSRIQLLTDNYWKQTAAVWISSERPGIIEDLYTSMEECNKDDLTRFAVDGTVMIDEGALRCEVNDPQTYVAGTWVFNSDQSIITLTDNSSSGPEVINLYIEELTQTSLKVRITEEVEDKIYTQKLTYSVR